MAEKTDGRRCVGLQKSEREESRYEISVCSNGWQTTIVQLDQEMLEWLYGLIRAELEGADNG